MERKLRVYDAQKPPTAQDIVDFNAFLTSDSAASEAKLAEFFGDHPSLIGVLGFSHFLLEHPLYKPGADGILYADRRRRDRADILAAKPRKVGQENTSYRSTHIIELKSANTVIASRPTGTRLSVAASSAIEQLHEYCRWLTTVPENKKLLTGLGWDVRKPMLHVIMGRDTQFDHNPGQSHEIEAHFIELGVCLWTVDKIVGIARRYHEESISTPPIEVLIGQHGIAASIYESWSDEDDYDRERREEEFEILVRDESFIKFERLLAKAESEGRIDGRFRCPICGMRYLSRYEAEACCQMVL